MTGHKPFRPHALPQPDRVVLDDGRPIRLAALDDRVGRGPWARWFVTALVPDETSERAERGRELARAGSVHTVTVRAGEIAAQVIGSSGDEYSIRLTADPVPASIWGAVRRSPQGRELVAATLARSPQSIRLEHMMVADWEEPLVPRAWSIVRRCDCADARRESHAWVCKHVAAAAFVVGEAIDRDVTLLFRWRGCDLEAEAAGQTPHAGRTRPDAWTAGPLPALAPPRPLPRGAVLKRLGRSGIVVGGRDLTEALAPAYDALAGADRE